MTNSEDMLARRYRPEIDGLRAIAVIAVVMFHLGLGLPGGFIGVDVFFVISGFLITGIIRRGLENNSFSLAEFWERRIRRIFPALFVVLVATLSAGYWLLLPNELVELGRSSVAQGLLLANVYFWRDTGYFAGPAESKPLLHTWSLAVEEQFYLFFPLALCLLKRLSSKRLFGLLALAALISFAASVYGTIFHTGATFYLLPTRAWELLIGCMLAVLPWKCSSKPRRDSAIAATGLLGIVLPVFFYDSETPFPGVAALPPVVGTAAVIFATANTPSLWLRKALSLRSIVFIGLISYSLYLWHWPVIVYTRLYFGHFHGKQIIFACVASFSLAALSWKFVENPFRDKSILKRRRTVFVSALTLTTSAVLFSALFVASDGAIWRYPGCSINLFNDVTWQGDEFVPAIRLERPIGESDLVTLGVEQDARNGVIDFVVWGDSQGMALCHSMNVVASDFELQGKSFVRSSFLPIPNVEVRSSSTSPKDGRRREQFMKFLDEVRPRNLMLVARWARYIGYSNEAMGDKPIQLVDTRSNANAESATEIVKRNLRELNSFCSHRGITLWIVKQVPETGERSPASTYLKYVLGESSSLSNQRRTRAEHDAMVAPMEEIFDFFSAENVRFVDPAPLLFDDDEMTINYWEGRSVYKDDDHLTRWGGEYIRPVFEELFREISNQSSTQANTNE